MAGIKQHLAGPGVAAAVPPMPDVFRGLVSRRRWLILCCSLFALAFYLAQVALSVFTTVLDGFAAGPFTWGWVYALGQFIVPLIVLYFYQTCSAGLDREANRLGLHADV